MFFVESLGLNGQKKEGKWSVNFPFFLLDPDLMTAEASLL